MERAKSRAEIQRLIAQAGTPAPALDRITLPELEDDPAPPEKGATLYCVRDNGSSKRELRVLFPTGAPLPLETEV